MKRFFAALAMVSVLMIAESHACVNPEPIEQVELRFKFLKIETMRLSGVKARAYLAVINAEPPETDFKAENIIIATGNWRVSVAAVVNGNVCMMDYLVYTPELHKRGLVAADRSSI